MFKLYRKLNFAPRALVVLSLVLLGTTGGCRLLVDVDQPQCDRDLDCAELLGSDRFTCSDHGVCQQAPDPTKCVADTECEARFGEDYACNDGLCEEDNKLLERLPEGLKCLAQPPTAWSVDRTATVTAQITIIDFLSLAPATGVVVRACGPKDVECNTPVSEDVMVDEDGVATIELPHGFSGYFELTGEGYVPSLFSWSQPFLTDSTLDGPAILTPVVTRALAENGQEGLIAGTGIVIADLADCGDIPQTGVRIEIAGADLEPFYFTAGLPDRMLQETHLSTELGLNGKARAVGGFSNLPPGYTTVDATLVDPEVLLGSATVIIRPDSMTFVRLTAGEFE